MRDSANALQLKVYAGPTSTTEVQADALDEAVIESFGTVFPAGLFTTARISVPQELARTLGAKESYRVAIFNGLQMVWEGVIGEIGLAADRTTQKKTLECVGQWGPQIRSKSLNKVWADNRLSEAVWVQQSQGDNDNLINVDRLNRIGVGPQAIAWTAGEVAAAFRYTMPTGQTIKRIVATLKNRESGQDWTTRLRDTVGGSTLASESGDGVTTAFDVTLATPRQYIEFQLLSNANQTPGAAVYGRMSGVMVYSETGAIDPTEIVKDIRALLSGLNSDEQYIASNTFALTPFMTNGQEFYETVLQRLAGFGDASFNPWAAYLGPSEWAAVPDGKPVLCFGAYPALTDYDYAVTLEELEDRVEFKRAVEGQVYNWVSVRYRDELSNRDVVLTPNDDAALKDQTSIDLYGERHTQVDAGTATATTAKNFAKRVLAWKKDAKYRVTSPLKMKGTVRTKAGTVLPVCRVRAGQRVKIENFLTDEVGVLNAGLTALITGTVYRPADETIEMTTGVPDNLAVFLARRELLSNRLV